MRKQADAWSAECRSNWFIHKGKDLRSTYEGTVMVPKQRLWWNAQYWRYGRRCIANKTPEPRAPAIVNYNPPDHNTTNMYGAPKPAPSARCGYTARYQVSGRDAKSSAAVMLRGLNAAGLLRSRKQVKTAMDKKSPMKRIRRPEGHVDHEDDWTVADTVVFATVVQDGHECPLVNLLGYRRELRSAAGRPCGGRQWPARGRWWLGDLANDLPPVFGHECNAALRDAASSGRHRLHVDSFRFASALGEVR